MTDWTAESSALIAAAGLVFAGWQVMLSNRQAREERDLSVQGVVVHWRPTSAPTPSEVDADGYAVWKFDIAVENPGRFPIDHVEVRWVFPVPVQRCHYDGHAEQPGTELLLGATPVLPGGGGRTWSRDLRIAYARRPRLSATYAEVTFTDIRGVRRTNRWPRG